MNTAASISTAPPSNFHPRFPLFALRTILQGQPDRAKIIYTLFHTCLMRPIPRLDSIVFRRKHHNTVLTVEVPAPKAMKNMRADISMIDIFGHWSWDYFFSPQAGRLAWSFYKWVFIPLNRFNTL
jgi:hypothetical protein